MLRPIRVVPVLLALVVLAGAQQNHHPGPPVPPNPGQAAPDIYIPPDMAHEMAKRRNLERQAELKKDTDRLYQLAGELKQAVDKSNENVLSLDVIRKADEVEKLAKQIKDKMKG